MNHWERLDLRNGRGEVHDFFSVVGTEDDSPFPLAIFAQREDAEAWVKGRGGNAADYAVLVTRPKPVLTRSDEWTDELCVWNCIDNAPEGEPCL